MAEQSKVDLKAKFKDGDRPSGADFRNLIDSFVNKIDDAVNIDPNSNLNLPGGVNLGDAATGKPGTLRFNGGNVQVFDGGSWQSIAGGSGAFSEVAGGPDVAFANGNVGIGNFPAAPAFKLEVELGNNVATADRVKFGNAVISNGQGASQSFAQFCHADHATGNTNFALRQGPSGDVNLNAPNGQPIMITHNRTSPRLFVSPAGPVVIGSNALLIANPVPPNPPILLQVAGEAFKLNGGAAWLVPSDRRLKTDIRPFADGLEKLMQVKPVQFRYNGQLNTDPEREEVGVIGQEMQEVFPYMIYGKTDERKKGAELKQGDDVLMYNGNALTYVMVNAIQELSKKVAELEKKLAAVGKQQAIAGNHSNHG